MFPGSSASGGTITFLLTYTETLLGPVAYCKVRKESFLLACNLVYPSHMGDKDEWSFCDILKRSLCPKQTTPAWCENCSKFLPTSQSRVLQALPNVLSVNTGLHNAQHKQFWQTQMDKVVAKVSTIEVNNRSSTPTSVLGSSKPCRYGDLCSRPGCRFRHSFDNAVPIPPSKNPYCSNNWLPHRFELAIKTEDLEIKKLKKMTSISPVSPHEATWFSLDWKVPCVLFYTSREAMKNKLEVKQQLPREVLSEDTSVAGSGNPRLNSFTPLHDNETLKPGDLVAMDAEFVTLNQEEAELRSDGKMSTIKPSQMSVARITCIRGSGPMEGTPFIDDYISTQEQVVDYLTKFSGIKPGDLDANISSKHLTTLKSTYKKLRYLLDLGVIFVGHGLKNDFRVINLVVRPEQVVDTVQLFHLPHHRMVSLRFLAWHFLGMKIQSETHDSVEDARAALQLFKKYKQLDEQKRVGEALAELYETGKVLNWKVPED
ncbi:unnamed protein product [Diabrotica balteata]|uniref:Exonuclease domain-containing protein n=1 Tax=Diabrotica balteata TaxID=107213 RepID=A0A9N9T8D9_DIABA|nr:unnamed protein product [Diabrotica balteata]